MGVLHACDRDDQLQPPAGHVAAGYLQLLSQLTKVGDYDEATFKGKLLRVLSGSWLSSAS